MPDHLLVGSYSVDGEAARVSIVRREKGYGELRLTAWVPADSPSFLARHPALPVVYGLSERPVGTVRAWRLGGGVTDPQLSALGPVCPTGTSEPCHLAVDPAGRFLVAAGYADGGISVHALAPDGAITAGASVTRPTGGGPDPQRQAGPHAHMCAFLPGTADILLSTDLGADLIRSFRLEPAGRLVDLAVTHVRPGTGPRHLTFGSRGRIFLTGELSSTVTAWEYDRVTQSLRPLAETVALADDPPAGVRNYPSEVIAGPGVLWVGNRGADVITTIRVTADGTLTPVADTPTGGVWPRHFVRIGAALYVANQHSGSVTTLPLRGDVPGTATGSLALPEPACLLAL